MAYEKTIWATGDVVTAEKLNHMEEGIEAGSSGGGGSVLIVPVFNDTSVGKSILQRSYRDLLIDFDEGKAVFASFPNASGYHSIRLVSFVGEIVGTKTVWITPSHTNQSMITVTVSGENDFPSWDDE